MEIQQNFHSYFLMLNGYLRRQKNSVTRGISDYLRDIITKFSGTVNCLKGQLERTWFKWLEIVITWLKIRPNDLKLMYKTQTSVFLLNKHHKTIMKNILLLSSTSSTLFR